ncbi:Putative pentatricopeptide repeat-containing protein At3g49142 [Linum grandiflorum]
MNRFISFQSISIPLPRIIDIQFRPLARFWFSCTTHGGATTWNSYSTTSRLLLLMDSCSSMLQLKQIQALMTTTSLVTHTFPVSRALAFCALADSGDIDHAHALFINIQNPNIYMWNTIIRGYAKRKIPRIGFSIFRRMLLQRAAMDARTFASALKLCEQFSTAFHGKSVHAVAWKTGFSGSLLVGNVLIHFYGAHRLLELSAKVFHEIPVKDAVSWTSMIDEYAATNCYTDALKHFDYMLSAGVEPNEITMITVLSACSQMGDLETGKSVHAYITAACSHGGLVEEGREYFKMMEKQYGIEPKREHYACMIDMLGRAGILEDAYKLIRWMPMAPREAAWGALLNACRMHGGNIELAKLAAHKLVELDPEDSGIYVLLATVCARDKRWGDVSMVRNIMKEKRVKKNPGRSLIEIEGDLHEFLAGDTSHPQSDAIRQALKDIFMLSKMEDTDPDDPPSP